LPHNDGVADPLLVPGKRTRKVKRGQLFGFTFSDPRTTVLGRVVRDDARPGSFRSARYLVYIYGLTNLSLEDLDSLSAALKPEQMIFPPMFTNLAGWSGGWFWPIGDAPISPDLELAQHSFVDSSGAYFDEYTNPLSSRVDPVGLLAFTGYNGIALKAFHVLGLETGDGKTASHLFAEQFYRR
jgi:hypothetical protein